MTAAAPTYLPNDRAFGATNEKNAKRLCNTLVFVGIRVICIYIYIYTRRFLPTVLPTVVGLDWFLGRLFSRLSRLVRRGTSGHVPIALRDKCTPRTGSLSL